MRGILIALIMSAGLIHAQSPETAVEITLMKNEISETITKQRIRKLAEAAGGTYINKDIVDFAPTAHKKFRRYYYLELSWDLLAEIAVGLGLGELWLNGGDISLTFRDLEEFSQRTETYPSK